MAAVSGRTTLGRLVAERPAAAAVLEQYGIDYCCGGKRSLEEACREKGINVDELLHQIVQREAEARKRAAEPATNWLERPLSQLCDHIEQTHHAYLRNELPRLSALMEKVVATHAQKHPELHELHRVFNELRRELETHMIKEEHVLFPAIRRLEQDALPAAFPFGSVANPIGVMEAEHESAARALERIRELTAGYRVPEDACEAYRALLNGLRELTFDLHRHIHKENHILFPRAVELERHR